VHENLKNFNIKPLVLKDKLYLYELNVNALERCYILCCLWNHISYCLSVLFCKKIFAGTKKLFAGTNTREISEMTLFLVIYTEIS